MCEAHLTRINNNRSVKDIASTKPQEAKWYTEKKMEGRNTGSFY